MAFWYLVIRLKKSEIRPKKYYWIKSRRGFSVFLFLYLDLASIYRYIIVFKHNIWRKFNAKSPKFAFDKLFTYLPLVQLFPFYINCFRLKWIFHIYFTDIGTLIVHWLFNVDGIYDGR